DDPFQEDWLRFRLQALIERLRAVRSVAGTGPGAPAVGVEMPLPRAPVSLMTGPIFDLSDIVAHANFVWTSSPIRIDSTGRLLQGIGAFKAVSSEDCRLIVRCLTPIDVAQAMAFGRDPGLCLAYFHNGQISGDPEGHIPVNPECLALARFLRGQREFFQGVH